MTVYGQADELISENGIDSISMAIRSLERIETIDEKYGNTTVNKSQKLKRQCLTAAKLSFAFPKENKLSYLNDMYFEIKPTWFDKIDKKL